MYAASLGISRAQAGRFLPAHLAISQQPPKKVFFRHPHYGQWYICLRYFPKRARYLLQGSLLPELRQFLWGFLEALQGIEEPVQNISAE
jgi:hypothetical protein